jgi:hypothetical protein
VGVWFVRENVRALFKGSYERFTSLEEALNYVAGQVKLPIRQWASRSQVLGRLREARLL